MSQEPSKTSIRFIINDIQYENITHSNDTGFRWNSPIRNTDTPTPCATCTTPAASVSLPPFASIKTTPEIHSVVHTVNTLPATSCQTHKTNEATSLSQSATPVHNPILSTPTTQTNTTTTGILSRKTPSSMMSRPKKSPYQTDAYMNWTLENLRAQHYCKALNDAEADSQRFYQCVFSPSCDRKMKGKGNLRRHIEWHLKKVEQDARCRGNVLLPEEYKQLKTNGFLEQQKKTELQKIRMEQRNILQKQLHTQLQQLVQT